MPLDSVCEEFKEAPKLLEKQCKEKEFVGLSKEEIEKLIKQRAEFMKLLDDLLEKLENYKKERPAYRDFAIELSGNILELRSEIGYRNVRDVARAVVFHCNLACRKHATNWVPPIFSFSYYLFSYLDNLFPWETFRDNQAKFFKDYPHIIAEGGAAAEKFANLALDASPQCVLMPNTP